MFSLSIAARLLFEMSEDKTGEVPLHMRRPPRFLIPHSLPSVFYFLTIQQNIQPTVSGKLLFDPFPDYILRKLPFSENCRIRLHNYFRSPFMRLDVYGKLMLCNPPHIILPSRYTITCRLSHREFTVCIPAWTKSPIWLYSALVTGFPASILFSTILSA